MTWKPGQLLRGYKQLTYELRLLWKWLQSTLLFLVSLSAHHTTPQVRFMRWLMASSISFFIRSTLTVFQPYSYQKVKFPPWVKRGHDAGKCRGIPVSIITAHTTPGVTDRFWLFATQVHYLSLLGRLITHDPRHNSRHHRPIEAKITKSYNFLQLLHWLPIKHRINFNIASITFRTLQSSQPVYLRSILHTHHSTRSLRLSNTNLLCAPFVRT